MPSKIILKKNIVILINLLFYYILEKIAGKSNHVKPGLAAKYGICVSIKRPHFFIL